MKGVIESEKVRGDTERVRAETEKRRADMALDKTAQLEAKLKAAEESNGQTATKAALEQEHRIARLEEGLRSKEHNVA